MEMKPLNHFLPGSPMLSLGATDCNLTCKFVQDFNKNNHLNQCVVNHPHWYAYGFLYVLSVKKVHADIVALLNKLIG